MLVNDATDTPFLKPLCNKRQTSHNLQDTNCGGGGVQKDTYKRHAAR